MTRECLGRVPFPAHIELLQSFLAQREQIVERTQGLLNAQRKPIPYLRDRALLSRELEDCFFTASVAHAQLALRGQLEEVRQAGGFRPRQMPGLHNDVIDPAEMIIRAFHLWRQTRWPGRSGRIRYAHTLFNLYVIRRLELLSLHLWDAGPSSAGGRLSQLQGVLDGLWRVTPTDQPVFVRDARWLIPLAQSPTTDELAPYFEVAERITESFSEEDRIEVHKACVQTAGGHLRSQLRHYCMTKGVSLDEHSLVLSSRNSNALDFAILIQGLVPLLKSYERAIQSGDSRRRLEFAGAICQGISPDPELFINRLDLLAAYSMIEHLFIAADAEGNAAYTPVGLRHVGLLNEYDTLIRRLSMPLRDDCGSFKPVEGAYSPYGVIYGFSSNLTEHMALKALQPERPTRFSLEDVFVDGIDRESSADKLAWVSGWRKLPHIEPEVQRMFDYPQRFAEDIFGRIEDALRSRVFEGETDAGLRTGRLFLVSADEQADSKTSLIPDLPIRYIASSDMQIVAAHRAHSCEEAHLLHERQEGMFMVSYPTRGGWVAVTKDVLTEVLGAARDAKLVGLPRDAAATLKLMCPDLVVIGPTGGSS